MFANDKFVLFFASFYARALKICIFVFVLCFISGMWSTECVREMCVNSGAQFRSLVANVSL